MWVLIAVVIALVGMCAAFISRKFPDKHESVYFWTLALVCLPSSLTIGLQDILDPPILAALIIFIATLYWGISYYARASIDSRWGTTLAVMAGLLPLLAVYEANTGAVSLVVCLLVAVLVNAELSLRTMKAWFALIALFAALLVPAFIGQGVTTPAISASAQAWAYVALAAFLVLWRQQLRGLGESFEAVGIVGYLLAVLTALAYALASSPVTTFTVGLVLSMGLSRLSRRELLPEAFVYLSVAISAYALLQLSDINGWPLSFNALILATYGALVYFNGWRTERPRQATPLRFSGLLLAFLGVYPGLLTAIPPLEPVAALATGGILLWLEARWQGWSFLRDLAIGILMVLSLDWLFRYEQIANLQCYTLPAVAYFAYLAWRRRKLEHEEYDIFVAGALAFLTVPLAAQAYLLRIPGYSLILFGVALGVWLAGSIIGYNLIRVWGLVMLAATTLYETPFILSTLSDLLGYLSS